MVTLNAVFEVERHGYDAIPADERTMTLRQTAWFWTGTNANLFFLSVGVIAIELGLSTLHALIAVVIGNSLFVFVGVAAVAGVRSGLPTMTLSRAAFGPRGNIPHAFLAWLASVAFEAINCLFGVYAMLAIMRRIGWNDPGWFPKVVAAFVILAGSAVIAVYGHATMVHLQRFFAFGLTAVLGIVMAYTVADVDWTSQGRSNTSGWMIVASIMTASAVVASGPISYLFNGPDWTRYLPVRSPTASIVKTVSISSGAIALLLSVMGVLLASRGDMSDPVGGVEPFVPNWLFVLYALAAIGGSISNNVGAYYSSGLCLQSLGVPLQRHHATVVDTVVSTVVVLYVILVHDFTSVLRNFVAVLVVWLAPFAAVWLTDGVMRGWRYEADQIHDTTSGSRYWAKNGFNIPGCIAFAVGAVVSLLAVHAPVLEGSIGRALGGADLSWIIGPMMSSLVYWGLARPHQLT